MANIKSSKKRILIGQRNAARNKAVRSRVKTEIKKVNAAVASGDAAAAQEAFKTASSVISKAGGKGVYHKNNMARKISKLAKSVNSLQAN